MPCSSSGPTPGWPSSSGEDELATHQSGHNSGVLHAGLYYVPGSLKARFCREGKAALEAYAEARGIPFERCGKLVVATDESELPALERLRERAEANGVPGLEVVGPERIAEIEPEVRAVRGLWSPGTGIIDYRRVALAYADDVRAAGGTIHTDHAGHGHRRAADGVVVRTSRGDIAARAVIACAGLWADEVARMTPGAGSERIVPFRGDYYTLSPSARCARPRTHLPRPRPALPVPRGALHQAHRRPGVGRPQRRPGLRPRPAIGDATWTSATLPAR